MKYLLDTNMVTYYTESHPGVVERLESIPRAARYVSLITVGELYHGIFNSRDVEKNLLRYRHFVLRTKILPFTRAIAERFGRSKADLQKRGELIADHDLWIAAHALVHGATLVTNNERHFRRIPNLKIENWTQ